MNLRATCLVITVIAAGGLLVGLGVLFFGTPDQAARIPASGLLVAAVAALAGTIYLGAGKPRASSVQKSQPMFATIGFGILVVIALFLVGVFLTHH
jgi:drug/metabolite transporter (DMT)-like permease